MFKLWSETNKGAKEKLRPDLGFRGWDELSREEKERVWQHLNLHAGPFFNYVLKTICFFNENYKYKNFTPRYLRLGNQEEALIDFQGIFMNQEEDVVMELFSVYVKFLYESKVEDQERMRKEKDPVKKAFKSFPVAGEQHDFDIFLERINDTFLQFGVKWYLTEEGFVSRQDEKIVQEIYDPVLAYLQDAKWKEVSRDLSDAFIDYRMNTPQGYSGCVTKTISAVQAFLQILVRGQTGEGDIALLIKEAKKEGLIPDDVFTETIFRNVESIFARERQATADAHPKVDYANEKSARMILNLAMVFIQYCMQKDE